jgi:hypothetical protein
MALMRKIGNGTGAGLNAAQVAFLKDEDLPDGQPYDIELEHEVLTRSWVSDQAPFRDHPSARQLWTEHGAVYLAEHIKAYPGTRPAAWWRFETLDNGEPLVRLKIGGIGTPWGDHQMAYGAALIWVTEKNKDSWHGAPGPAIDPANPPVIESEATFLDRHGFLTAAERAKLTDDDFAPEAIDAGDDDDE